MFNPEIWPETPYGAYVTDLLQVCALENTESVRLLMWALSVEPGQLCHTFIPSLQILVESLMMNVTAVTDAVFQAVIGDPSTYDVQSDWYSIVFIRLKGFSFKGFHSGEQRFVQKKLLSPSSRSSHLLSLLYNLLNSITAWTLQSSPHRI